MEFRKIDHPYFARSSKGLRVFCVRWCVRHRQISSDMCDLLSRETIDDYRIEVENIYFAREDDAIHFMMAFLLTTDPPWRHHGLSKGRPGPEPHSAT